MTRILIHCFCLWLGSSTAVLAAVKDELFSAVKLRQHDTVKTMMAAGVDVDQSDNKGYTPLFYASIKGYPQITSLLISAGADVNKIGRRGWTPLLGAALHGHNAIITSLLDSGADINHRNSENFSALMLAVQRGQPQTAKLLLERGAQRVFLNEPNAMSVKSLLALAVQNNDVAMVELLLAAGVKINTENIAATPILFLAAALDDSAIFNLLIKKSANLKQRDKTSNSLLHFAAIKSKPALLNAVLQTKPDQTAVNMQGETALVLAAKAGTVDNMLRLLALASRKQQQAALFAAVTSGQKSMLAAILAEGVDVNAIDSDGTTTLMAAVQGRHDHLLPLLIAQGADLEARNNNGQTALLLAVQNAPIKLKTVLALVDAGADTKAKDTHGNNAVMLVKKAECKQQQALLDALSKRGR